MVTFELNETAALTNIEKKYSLPRKNYRLSTMMIHQNSPMIWKKRLQQHEKQSLIMENRLPFMFRRQHLKR